MIYIGPSSEVVPQSQKGKYIFQCINKYLEIKSELWCGIQQYVYLHTPRLIIIAWNNLAIVAILLMIDIRKYMYSIYRNDYKDTRIQVSSWLITGFVTRLIRRVPLVEKELLTLPEQLRFLVGFVLLDL